MADLARLRPEVRRLNASKDAKHIEVVRFIPDYPRKLFCPAHCCLRPMHRSPPFERPPSLNLKYDKGRVSAADSI